MKKLFALTLAVAMVLSVASVAFAAKAPVNFATPTDYYGESSAKVVQEGVNDPMIGYGKTAYFPLLLADGFSPVTSYDDVKGLKTKGTWTQNGDLVSKIEVIKKETSASGKMYFVAVTFVAKDSTASADIVGKIELSNSGDTFGGLKTGVINTFIKVGYGYATTLGNDTAVAFGDTDKIYNFGTAGVAGGGDVASKLVEDEEAEFELYGGAGKFVVDTRGQGKILLSNSVAVEKRAEIEAKYPDANFFYLNGNGKSFNRTGLLYINCAEGSVIYSIVGDKLVKTPGTYDSTEEAFVVKTRTIGSYVIADAELDLTMAPEIVAPVVPVEPANPTTGAAV